MCSTCEQLRIKFKSLLHNGSREKVEMKKKNIWRPPQSAEQFYSSLCLNTKIAKQNKRIYTISFDFQQNLQLPHIPIGDIFYMQQLWLYILGMYSCGDNQVSMYCWPESTAKRGSSEIISCLDHFLSAMPRKCASLKRQEYISPSELLTVINLEYNRHASSIFKRRVAL